MSEGSTPIGGSISRVGDEAVIRIPLGEVQHLRVALQECPCKSNKTNAGIALRKRIAKGLGRVLFNKQPSKEM